VRVFSMGTSRSVLSHTNVKDKRLFQKDWAWPTPKWRNGWQFPLVNLQVSQTAAARCFVKCGEIWQRAGVNKQFRYKLSSVHIPGLLKSGFSELCRRNFPSNTSAKFGLKATQQQHSTS